MRRRPLCLAALLLILSLWLLPKDVWLRKPDIPSGEKLSVSGTVVWREQKEEKQAYILKNCRFGREHSKISIFVYLPSGESYPIGCELSLYGTIYQLNKADNPGQFDQESFYQSQGILYTFQADRVLTCNYQVSFGELPVRLREFLAERLAEVYEERDAGILKAVFLGDKSSLRKEDQLLYQKNGISHLLAISGLHISLIGMSVYQFLRKCRLTFAQAGLPSGLLLLFYGMMTGFGVSSVRAVCMFLVMIFADILGRAYDMASAMSLAAIVILLRNPLQAFQAGFLLSFGAVFGICCVYPVLQSVFQPKKKRTKTLLFSLSVSFVTYPLTVHFFYEYPLYSLFLNLIVIPCMPFVMIFGALGLLGGCLFLPLGKIMGFPAHVLLSFYELLGEGAARLPWAVLRPGREARWQLAVFFFLLTAGFLLLWYGRRRIYALCLPLAILIVSLRFRSGLEFTMLDVGQGDGLFLRIPNGICCLVDGGSSNVKQVGEYRLLPYLKYEGVSTLDYVILTHLDEDHVSGVRELLEMMGTGDGVLIKGLLLPDIEPVDEKYTELWKLAEEKGVRTGKIGSGDIFYGKDWKLECLYPIKGSFCADKNESSTVLELEYGRFSMLLTGDLGEKGEVQLLEEKKLKDIDVWKVSHHGSKNSGSEEFLEVIRPNLSLISAGKKNRYGHPSKELLKRLSAAGSQIGTTIEGGALSIISDGSRYTLSMTRQRGSFLQRDRD